MYTYKIEIFLSALSQSVEDCTATVHIVGTTQVPNQIDIPLGTVCVECVVNGEVDTSTTTFLIGNSPITSLDGGVLVVDTSMTFQASPDLTLRCVSGSEAVRQASVFLDGMSPMFVQVRSECYYSWSVSFLCVCLSVCYHVFCNHAQRDNERTIPKG